MKNRKKIGVNYFAQDSIKKLLNTLINCWNNLELKLGILNMTKKFYTEQSVFFSQKKQLFPFSLVFLFLCIVSSSNGQVLYFKLKNEVEKAVVTNEGIKFNQPEINKAVSNLQVLPAMKNADKYKSKYAQILSRTYQIDLNTNRVRDRKALEQNLKNSFGVDYVEYADAPILLSCPTDDPSDAAWNLSRHEITCVQEAHCITQGDPAISIAARDNGFIADHPEHDGQVVYAEPGAYDEDCHGTQTSITSAGGTDNGFGISSSGFNCSLMLYRWDDFCG